MSRESFKRQIAPIMEDINKILPTMGDLITAAELNAYDRGYIDGAQSRDEEINELKTQLMMQKL